MSWTKRRLVDKAFEELALGSTTYNITDDERAAALSTLDSMMAEWNQPGLGIRIGYLLNLDPDDASLDDESGIPLYANKAVYLNLALELAPSYGKAVPKVTAARAKRAYDNLLSSVMAEIPEMQLPGNLPSGAGSRVFGTSPFVAPPEERITTGPDGPLELP